MISLFTMAGHSTALRRYFHELSDISSWDGFGRIGQSAPTGAQVRQDVFVTEWIIKTNFRHLLSGC
jgi:hypothetical protein